jgi:hypothetical protein
MVAQTAPNPEVDGFKNLSFSETFLRASFDTGQGQAINSFKSVGLKRTLTVGEGIGPGGLKVARSTGQMSYAASVIFRPDGQVRLNQALGVIAAEKGFVRDGNKRQIGLVEWDLILVNRMPGAEIARTFVLHKCRLTDADETWAEGEALQESPHELNIMDAWEQDPEDPDIQYVLK